MYILNHLKVNNSNHLEIGGCDAVELAKEYGTPDAKVYTDYKELLADPTIDAVHVLTPNIAHCEITVAALEAGKHVLCEKPMAMSATEAQAMIDAAKKTLERRCAKRCK